jgi:hypothetical protein
MSEYYGEPKAPEPEKHVIAPALFDQLMTRLNVISVAVLELQADLIEAVSTPENLANTPGLAESIAQYRQLVTDLTEAQP